MMDEADLAYEMEAEFLKMSLEAVRSNTTTGPSKTHCEECGNKIPERRRQAVPGCRMCVRCQAEFEKAGGQ